MINRFSFFLFILLTSFIFPQDRLNKIDDYFQKCFQNGLFNGAVLIADSDSIIYAKGFGYSNFEEKAPFEIDTRSYIASITKQFTATIIMQLYEEGKIKLTDNLLKFFPDYPAKTGEKVTIHHLLTNTSGIYDYFMESLENKPVNDHSFKYYYTLFKDKDLLFEPGTKFEWSNSGWILLGKIIEIVEGKSYVESLNQRILLPLKLKQTGTYIKGNNPEDIAIGYIADGDGYRIMDEVDFSGDISADGIYTSVKDLFKFCNTVSSGKFLNEETTKLLLSPKIKVNNRLSYAYGWNVAEREDESGIKGFKFINLPGGMFGYSSDYTKLNNRFSIILSANTSDSQLDRIRNAIIAILTDNNYPAPKKQFIPFLMRILKEKGEDEVLPAYIKLKMEKADTYEFSETLLNQFGYRLINERKIELAIKIFRQNVSENPTSWNVYDSLGEALSIKGDNEGAIENYKKSIELNPDNTNGVTKLRELEK